MVTLDREAPIRVVPFDPSYVPVVRQFAARYWSRPTSDEYYAWRYLEALPFGREALNQLLDLGDTGIRQLIALQRGLVGSILGK